MVFEIRKSPSWDSWSILYVAKVYFSIFSRYCWLKHAASSVNCEVFDLIRRFWVIPGKFQAHSSPVINRNFSPVHQHRHWFHHFANQLFITFSPLPVLVCVLFGLWNCLSILLANVTCLVGGILQVCIGFVVMAVEAPFCCMFIDHVQTLAGKVEERPLWNRAAVYCL